MCNTQQHIATRCNTLQHTEATLRLVSDKVGRVTLRVDRLVLGHAHGIVHAALARGRQRQRQEWTAPQHGAVARHACLLGARVAPRLLHARPLLQAVDDVHVQHVVPVHRHARDGKG